MSDLLWNFLPELHKERYQELLSAIAGFSGLFKELKGEQVVPYLYYRTHEIIFCSCFEALDLARKDSAFDAVLNISDERIGIGLKTWVATNSISYQKVAEFNRHSSILRKMFEDDTKTQDLILELGRLRNERITDDQRRNTTSRNIYHVVTRGNNHLYIFEFPYDLIDIDKICFSSIEKSEKSVSFYDGKNHYRFHMSKSTLFMRFDASAENLVLKIPVSLLKNPFDMIASMAETNYQKKPEVAVSTKCESSKSVESEKVIVSKTQEQMEQTKYIVLPLYNDSTYGVDPRSKFNASLGKSKTKGSARPRPQYEAYAPIPMFIHHLYPNFFGFDAQIDKEWKKSNFKLHLPNGEIISAKVTQQGAKALSSNPQAAFGKWLLHGVYGLKPYMPLTRALIDEKGYDSIIVEKIDNENFRIDLADFGTYERWKLDHRERLEYLLSKGIIDKRTLPIFRPEILD